MKTFFSVLAVVLAAIAVQAQQRANTKPAPKQTVASKNAEKKAPETAKKAEVKKEEFDINFRGQEQRVRYSIYTLGGRLTPPGKEPGEGC